MKKVIFSRLEMSANLTALPVFDVLFDFFALDYNYYC